MSKLEMVRDFVAAFVEMYGHAPTISEVSVTLGLKRSVANQYRLRALNPEYDASQMETVRRCLRANRGHLKVAS